MTQTIVTLADHNYVIKLLLMLDSLIRWSKDVRIVVLALDNETAQLTKARATRGGYDHLLRVIGLKDIAERFPEVYALRDRRDVAEFCWTCSSLSVCVALDSRDVQEDSIVTYVDADIYWWDSAERVAEELDNAKASIGICPHRFPPQYVDREASVGIYNVCIVSFRKDADGRRCAGWWAERCVAECCREKYGDQLYLQEFKSRHPKRVVAFHHPGIGVSPWNVFAHRVTLSKAKGCVVPFIDGVRVVEYHMHEWAKEDGRVHRTKGYPLRDQDIDALYLPFEEAYEAAEKWAEQSRRIKP